MLEDTLTNISKVKKFMKNLLRHFESVSKKIKKLLHIAKII